MTPIHSILDLCPGFTVGTNNADQCERCGLHRALHEAGQVELSGAFAAILRKHAWELYDDTPVRNSDGTHPVADCAVDPVDRTQADRSTRDADIKLAAECLTDYADLRASLSRLVAHWRDRGNPKSAEGRGMLACADDLEQLL